MYVCMVFDFGSCIADTCYVVVGWVKFSLVVIVGYSCVVCLSLDYFL